MNFWIVSDVCSDLPKEYVAKQEKLELIGMHYQIDGVDKFYTTDDADKIEDLYKLLGQGSRAKTSQINEEDYYKVFKRLSGQGEAILCIPLSSGISGSFQSAHIARKRLLAEMPSAQIEIVDSLSGSLGQGLLLDYTISFRNSGKSLKESAAFAENLSKKIEHWITLSDLQHLFRGGRLTRGAAFMGTILKIQPILAVNDEGKLFSKEKVKGRKNAVRELFNKLEKRALREKQKVFIAHSACLDEALALKEMAETLDFVEEVMIAPVGCVVGSHTGPGTLAIFFVGETRN